MQEDFKFEEDAKEPEPEPAREPVREPAREPPKEPAREPSRASSSLPPIPQPKSALRPPTSKFVGSSLVSKGNSSAYGTKRGTDRFVPEEVNYNHFYVGITGYIEYGDFPFLDGLCCRYSFTAGNSWELANVPCPHP
eukprot:TRINITY_DN7295_c0_g2_i2.p2 TRINITY_DN7295_c0_g2~~TRINITY_DN7295_c0_g2_i2.p2  ORF type:complete len:137 (+),score=19.60 TRINITY_DN7295_c0_g2_i2:94-504(+)